MKILILGSGPSGLVVANYLKAIGIKGFQIITTNKDGFAQMEFEGMKFSMGQRSLFYDDLLYHFFEKTVVSQAPTVSMTHKVGVRFKGQIYDYPIQNNLHNFSWWKRLKIYLNYLLRKRKLAEDGTYAGWVRGNYGNWLADNIILPHTWKTIKEDLYTIDAKAYGKKVMGMNLFRKQKEIERFKDAHSLLERLRENVEDNMVAAKVTRIDPSKKTVSYLQIEGDEEAITESYDLIFNTIAVTKFMDLVRMNKETPDGKYISDGLDASVKSLHFNNMFLSIFVVPSRFVNTEREIIYFPEREFAFSKVNINKFNGYTIITCETSFRRNNEDLFQNSAYEAKILERIESDLKKGGIVTEGMFVNYRVSSHILSPAYIICDEDYELSNALIQVFLEHHNIYNVGRFAEWKPNLRVEHTVARMKELVPKLFSGIKSICGNPAFQFEPDVTELLCNSRVLGEMSNLMARAMAVSIDEEITHTKGVMVKNPYKGDRDEDN